jgi:serine/threonine protein kinase
MSTSSQASDSIGEESQGNEKEFWLQTVFELGPRLGKGSFSVVYSAVHIETKKPVALKVRVRVLEALFFL